MTAVKHRNPVLKKPERYPLVLPMLRTLARDPVAEFLFHPTRKWRSDYAIPSQRLLIEIDGGVWSRGRHTRGAGFIEDQKKHNAAAVLGYRVLRFIPPDIASGNLMDTVCEALVGKIKKCAPIDKLSAPSGPSGITTGPDQ